MGQQQSGSSFPSLYCFSPEDVNEAQMSHADTVHMGTPLGANPKALRLPQGPSAHTDTGS